MNKNLLVGASLALALSSCSKEEKVVVEDVALNNNNFYFDKVLIECREKYEEFFLSEMCYQSETGNDSQRYFVPEIVKLDSEKSYYTYSGNYIFNYGKSTDTKLTKHKFNCEKVSNINCIQKSYYLILKEVEIELKEENDEVKRKELLFVYFYILDKWLASLV